MRIGAFFSAPVFFAVGRGQVRGRWGVAHAVDGQAFVREANCARGPYALYPRNQIIPIAKRALVARVDDFGRDARAYAFDAAQRGGIGAVDLDGGVHGGGDEECE
jgi:hypothetical protein